MLDLHRLRLLRELASRGTIAAVAQALAYTPSAVSQQLAVLEREAGLPLLERDGRRVRLTPAGRDLVAHADGVVAHLERAEAALAAARGAVTGVLRVGAFPSAARVLLPGVLIGLGRDHPRLEVMVEESDPVLAGEAVRAGRLDAALTHDYDLVPRPEPPALTASVVLTEPMSVVSGSPPADPGQPVASFRDGWWVLGRPGNMCRTAAERICQAAGFEPRVRHQTDDFRTAVALVAAGQGQAIMPALGLVDPPAVVVSTALPVRMRVRLVHRRGAEDHPAVVAFRQAVTVAVASYLSAAGAPAGTRRRRGVPSSGSPAG